jgi:hypothetical protein
VAFPRFRFTSLLLCTVVALSTVKSAAAQQFVQQGPKLIGNSAVYFETWINSVGGGGYGVVQGHAVAVSSDGNTALVGGYGDNGGVGAVWVFTRDGSGNWSQERNKLVGGAGANPGYSVALSADGNTGLTSGGVFTRDGGGNWSQQGELVSGGALSADGNTALVANPLGEGGWCSGGMAAVIGASRRRC